MSVLITCEYTKSIAGPKEYLVEAKVIDATGIELDIFVFATESDRFVSVATPYDMQAWPVGRAAALAAGKMHFRARGVLRSNLTVASAEYFLSVTQSRVRMLQSAWTAVVDQYPSTEIITVPTTP